MNDEVERWAASHRSALALLAAAADDAGSGLWDRVDSVVAGDDTREVLLALCQAGAALVGFVGKVSGMTPDQVVLWLLDLVAAVAERESR